MDGELFAERQRRQLRFRRVERQLERAVGQHRHDRRGRTGDLAGMADDVGDLPRRRRGQRALAEPPARLIERGLRLFDPALGGGDFIVARYSTTSLRVD